MSDLPKAIWSGSFNVLGVDVKCHVLEDGRRIMEEESLVALIYATGEPNNKGDAIDVEAFAKWYKGR